MKIPTLDGESRSLEIYHTSDLPGWAPSLDQHAPRELATDDAAASVHQGMFRITRRGSTAATLNQGERSEHSTAWLTVAFTPLNA